MSITRIKEWYNRFKDGSTSVDSEPRHGMPSTSRNDNVINQVRTLLIQDCRITVRELADKVGVSTGSVQTILTADLGVREICAEAASPGNRTRHAGLRRKWFQLPTWPLVIFGCFPNWKCRWKGPDLSQEKTFCGTWQPSWTWVYKELSRNVSSNGRTAGRSVCITKETTLKGIRVSDIQINNCIFADQRSDISWTDLVSTVDQFPEQ
jgi:hypothetical protein